MENKLSRLFDYQKFSGNDALASVIKDVESRYPETRELSDDELFFVNAAGAVEQPPVPDLVHKDRNK